jgi:hypothetical protein
MLHPRVILAAIRVRDLHGALPSGESDTAGVGQNRRYAQRRHGSIRTTVSCSGFDDGCS